MIYFRRFGQVALDVRMLSTTGNLTCWAAVTVVARGADR